MSAFNRLYGLTSSCELNPLKIIPKPPEIRIAIAFVSYQCRQSINMKVMNVKLEFSSLFKLNAKVRYKF